MRSYYIHLNSNFRIRNLNDFINGTCEIITRRIITPRAREIYVNLFFYRSAIHNIRKVQLVNQKLDIAYF